ncbi:chemotaxis response regulator protein-glutamate methylesterase [Skermanella mucosa]|uniref:protein-glutamate methylesterase/protein-glutamine glutaminase n=1 Tax=Skermanella mucosa TaxID=1789672 RepID=UPI00192C212F|nr:chemotaxis response regulator protein-glutamate methylesterase [Skermanella mucosa]UEM22368.1 chemotaxis response regulator protein-glutamate methylesterase [Skermanella mucosa]
MGKPIRVAIVDDSALMRRMLTEALAAEPGFEVVGHAADPYEAREMIKSANPDVLTLDVEMPRMDGLTFLEKIMTLRPMPVVMVSTLTREGADATVRALELGAIDCIAKPNGAEGERFVDFRDELVGKLKVAAHVRLGPPRAKPARAKAGARGGGGRLIALGASTGGVERIRDILEVLPEGSPPILIVQHMGAFYVPSFAARLDRQSAMTVRMAESGMRVTAGEVLIAPGDRHMALRRDGFGYLCEIVDGPPVSGHRPSVDVLFNSVAEVAGANAVGVILSGMGRDGASGMAAMRAAGAWTIGESEQSCVVYGMPRMAKLGGGVAVEMPLGQIPAEMLRAAAAPAARSS